jgi:hypothetical protein
LWYSVALTSGQAGWISASVVTLAPCISQPTSVPSSSASPSLVSDALGEACLAGGLTTSFTVPPRPPNSVGPTPAFTMGGNWAAKAGTNVTLSVRGGTLVGVWTDFIRLHLLVVRNNSLDITWETFAQSGNSRELTYTFSQDTRLAIVLAGTHGETVTLAIRCQR